MNQQDEEEIEIRWREALLIFEWWERNETQ